MISACFESDRETGALTMEVRGHAGFAELGKDPVCAGASVLAMTVAQGVKLLEEAGKLRERPRLRIREGEVLVTARPREEALGEARQLFRVGELGLGLLAEAYPENVELRSAREREAAGPDENDNTDSPTCGNGAPPALSRTGRRRDP